MSYYIYKHLDSNMDVIYIGQTIDMNGRQAYHKNNAEWSKEIVKVEFAEVYDKTMMDIMERYYISKYKPKYNKDFIDCYYYEYFEVKKDLEFLLYKKEKTRSCDFHAKGKLIYCSEIANLDATTNFNAVNTNEVKYIKNNFEAIITTGVIDKFKFKDNIKCINLLRRDYKAKLNNLGLIYFNLKTKHGTPKVLKFIYDLEYLKLIYFNSICLELTGRNCGYVSFMDLINNNLKGRYKHILNFKTIAMTPVSNIKSEVPIHNTEHIEFIEEYEDYYLGFIYGLCFKINKSYIIDEKLINYNK